MNKGILLSLLLLCSSITHAATLIDTVTPWDGTSTLSSFGETNTATYGQTFTVGADTILDDFTFYLNDFLDPDFVDFKAYVMEWDGTKATGPILYQSSTISTTNNGGADGFEAITINTGGITLVNGTQYVAFFSASDDFDAIDGRSSWGSVSTNPYAGGNRVYLNNGSDFSLLTINTWSISTGSDFAFTMNLSGTAPQAVPSLSQWGLFVLTLLLGFVGYRKTQRSKQF